MKVLSNSSRSSQMYLISPGLRLAFLSGQKGRSVMKRLTGLLVLVVSLGASVSFGKELKRKVIDIDFNSAISKAYNEAHRAEVGLKDKLSEATQDLENFDDIRLKSKSEQALRIKELNISGNASFSSELSDSLDDEPKQRVHLKVKVRKHDAEEIFTQALDQEISSLSNTNKYGAEN